MCLEGFSAADPSEESGEEIQRDTPRGGLEFLKIFEEFKHWATYPRCRLELEINHQKNQNQLRCRPRNI